MNKGKTNDWKCPNFADEYLFRLVHKDLRSLTNSTT